MTDKYDNVDNIISDLDFETKMECLIDNFISERLWFYVDDNLDIIVILLSVSALTSQNK